MEGFLGLEVVHDLETGLGVLVEVDFLLFKVLDEVFEAVVDEVSVFGQEVVVGFLEISGI